MGHVFMMNKGNSSDSVLDKLNQLQYIACDVPSYSPNNTSATYTINTGYYPDEVKYIMIHTMSTPFPLHIKDNLYGATGVYKLNKDTMKLEYAYGEDLEGWGSVYQSNARVDSETGKLILDIDVMLLDKTDYDEYEIECSCGDVHTIQIQRVPLVAINVIGR